MSNTFKVVLLGEGRVGKTCLLLRYVKNSFSPEQQSTLEASYLEKRLNIGNKTTTLQVWDTAGQEQFRGLTSIYYRGAAGALLVYDITDRESFNKVRSWVKELRKIVGKDIVLVIAGNKADLEKYRQVDEAEAVEYAESVNAVHIHCSAKTGSNVDGAFLELTKGMLSHATSASSQQPSAGEPAQQQQSNPRSKINFVEEGEQKSGCC